MFTFVKLPYSDKYKVCIQTFDIVDNKGNRCDLYLNKENEPVIYLDWFDGKKEYQIGLIPILLRFKSELTLSVLKAMRVGYKDERELWVDYKNIFIMFNNPVESEEYPGFYEIPYFPYYCVNKSGDVMSKRKNTLLKFALSKPERNNYKNILSGYYISTGTDWLGREVRISRHRLLALAFCKYTTDPEILTCNHINGVPGDDRWDNLELITRKANLMHAINNGLMPNSVKPIEVYFYNTNEIKKYRSVASAAKELNCSYGKLAKRAPTPWKRYSDGFSVKVSDGTEWPKLDDKITYVPYTGKVVALDILSGKKYSAISAERMSAIANVSPPSIRERCNTKSFKPVKNFIFKYENDEREFPNISNTFTVQ